MKVLFKVGDIVQYNGRSAKIIDAQNSGNPCACCGRFDHNPSLLATLLYLDDNTVVTGVDFHSLDSNMI